MVAEAPHLRADAQRNLERILAAARVVFTEDGLEASVADVAERAGVGTATIFRRFPTKDDLVAAMLEREAQVGRRLRASGGRDRRSGRRDRRVHGGGGADVRRGSLLLRGDEERRLLHTAATAGARRRGDRGAAAAAPPRRRQERSAATSSPRTSASC